jgi:hypothetical protein
MKMQKSVVILGAALFLSLSLNLFLGGMMLGRAYETGPRGRWAEKDRALAEQLSDADRAILKDAMTQNRGRLETLKKELDDTRTHVQEALQGGDKTEIDEALKAEQDKKAEILGLIQKTRAEALTRLSPAGQATLQKMTRAAEERFRSWRVKSMGRMMGMALDDDMLVDIGGPDDPYYATDTPPQGPRPGP